MPIFDESEQNALLDNQFGPAHGSAAPSSHELALFTDDPRDGGIEITGAGYARVTIANDATWPDAVGAEKSVTVTFPAPTGDWDEGNAWVLFNGTAMGAFDMLNDAVDVTAGDPAPEVEVTVYYPTTSNVSV